MDQRESHVQSLGICYRIYHFIMKTLTSQALKTVTLGRSMQFGSTKAQTSREEELVIKPETKEQKAQEKNSPGLNMNGEEKMTKEQKAQEKNSPGLNMNGEEKMVPPGKAPKKTVSINDKVEEIDDRENRKKRSKSFQKSKSLEQQQEEKENIKPLRPILKVKSNLDEKSIS